MKILIVQLGRIGDTVLTTPIFRTLGESSLSNQIYVLISQRGADILNNNPRLTGVFVYRKDPLSFLKLLFQLRIARFDWWIDPKDHYSKESSFLAKICGAKNKAGYNQGSENTFSVGLPSNNDNYLRNAAERNLQSLIPLGITTSSNHHPELFPDYEKQKKIREIYNPGPQTILLNISAFHRERYWPIEKWAFIASVCIKRKFKLLLTFKPEDLDLAESIQKLTAGIVLFRSTTINDVVALMPMMCLVITPDTSIVHIASAFNVPQITLFGNSEENLKKFCPLSDFSIVIQPKLNDEFQNINETEVVQAFEKFCKVKSEL